VAQDHTDRREPAVGARTQLAELVAAAATLVTMLLLAPFIGLMPEATLAAVVIVYSIGLIRPAEFRAILRCGERSSGGPWSRWSRRAARNPAGNRRCHRRLAVALAYQAPTRRSMCWGASLAPTSSDLVPRPSEDETFPGLLLLRLEGRIFFANAEHVGWKMRSLAVDAKPKVVRWISAVCTISSTRRSGC